jgi:biotin carboxyl carrier protein
MDELDPATAASREDLAKCLKRLHLLADRPSYRVLEKRTEHAGGLLPGTNLPRVPLRRATITDVLAGTKFPRKAFLLSFVEACGIDVESDPRWEQAWDRLAVQYQQASAQPGEVKELRQENEELRQQLAAAKSRTDAAENRRGDLEQARVQTAKSRLDLAVRRAKMAESLLEWERRLSGSRFMSVPMPQLGESVTEGTITRWLKKEGDHVEADEPLLEIHTGQGHTEIRAPVTGSVRAAASFLAGKTVATGTVLAVINEVTASSCSVSMPQLGESVTEGTITRWLKKEGDHVEADEPLLEVSTDKVDTEIPSPATGILRGIAVDKDETVEVGAQLAVIEPVRPAARGSSRQPGDLSLIQLMQEQHRQAIDSLDQTREEFERRVDDLRAFEREYRSRLKAYLERQLRDLEADLTDLPQAGPDLVRTVDDLRAFEREYRSRLKAYLERQLRDLEASALAAKTASQRRGPGSAAFPATGDNASA